MRYLMALYVFCFGAFHVCAQNIYVDASQTDDSGNGYSWATAKKTLQAAADIAVDGCVVLVTNGVYDEGGACYSVYVLTNRLVITNDFEVRSVNGPEVTFIVGQAGSNGSNDTDSVRGVRMTAGCLSGFTVANGYTMMTGGDYAENSGGGIHMAAGCEVTNCIVTGNNGFNRGGGIYSNGGDINNCIFVGNRAPLSYGGGGSFNAATLNNCVFRFNEAYYGGGAYVTGGGSANNCLAYSNSAYWGGGIQVNSAAILNNCTVTRNTGTYGGGVNSYAAAVVNNCVVWSNTATVSRNDIRNGHANCTNRYSCSSTDVTDGENGCTTNNPMFVDGAGGDYTLQAGSPCVNGGNNIYAPGWPTDLAEQPRIAALVVDMGAYEKQFSIWDGGGTDNNWSTEENWVSDTVPTNSEVGKLIFAGSTRLNNTNELEDPFILKDLMFDIDAEGFVLSGNDLTIHGGIENASSNAQTISSGIALGGSQMEVGGSGDVTLAGTISGSGDLCKTGTGALVLSASNTFDNAVTISEGTFITAAGATNALMNITNLVVQGGAEWLNCAGDSYGSGMVGTWKHNRSILVTGAGSMISNVFEFAVSGTGNQLAIRNGGEFVVPTNAMHIGFVGNNNAAIVDGTGSVWHSSKNIFVGTYGGDDNAVIVTNGGSVSGNELFLGYTETAYSNSVLLEGSGSVWSNSANLYVGLNGDYNRFVVSDNAAVYDNYGFVALYSNAANNEAWLDNSVWVNQYEMNVGRGGANNLMVITNGGVVYSTYGYVGHGTAAHSNTVVVTGSGSIWTNSGSVTVGRYGAENTLIITNGGAVYSGGEGRLGYGENSVGNMALLAGTGSIWSCAGYFYAGYSSSYNRVTITNGGCLVSGGSIRLGFKDTAHSNSILIEGSGSVMSNTGSWHIGSGGDYNQALVKNGGALRGRWGHVGRESSASHNVITIDGSGSLVSFYDEFNVGYSGGGNVVNVTNGAALYTKNSYLGRNSESTGNCVFVSGSGSVWSNSGVLDVLRGSNILDSGTMNIGELRLTNGSESVFVFDGGTLNVGTTLVDNASAFVVGDGSSSATMNLLGATNNLHSFVDGLHIQQSAALSGNGIISGGATNDGTLSPGLSASSGLLAFSNTLVLLANSTLAVELGGTEQVTDYDFVRVEGAVTLGGTLDVSLIDGFESSIATNDMFTVLESRNALSGAFANVADGGRLTVGSNSFLVSYGSGANTHKVVLSVSNSPTLVALYDFYSTEKDGVVAVHWKTASEDRTLGFELYRLMDGEWVKVNASLILAKGWGTEYVCVDTGADPKQNQTYRLVEYEVGGGRQVYGPFARSVNDMRFNSMFLTKDGLVIRWLSRTGDVYQVWRADSLLDDFVPVSNEIPGTPPLNSYTDDVENAVGAFYQIGVRESD